MAKVKDYRKRVDIIIPTFNNVQQLQQCVESMLVFQSEHPLRLIIVNNGEGDLAIATGTNVKIVNVNKNIGWTGALERGLEVSDSEYVMFANDDIFIPRTSIQWLKKMVRTLDLYPNIGAVGPSSNVVMGIQNIFTPYTFSTAYTSYLIGFCMLLRREALDKAGGVHHMQYGGDDLDLSIRLRKEDYQLVVDKDVFVYHHGFQTGEKVFGTPDKPGGWNSRDMTENTNIELIKKHGFREFHLTILNNVYAIFTQAINEEQYKEHDAEATVIRSHINGGKVVELGVGSRKTVDNAVGVDIIKKGDAIPYNQNQFSVADVVADVTQPLPFEDGSVGTIIARHVLEHCLDVPKTLKQWTRVLQDNGRLIIACPNENFVEGIPLNADHLHAFTPDSIVSYADMIGMKEVARDEYMNGSSFVIALEKECRA